MSILGNDLTIGHFLLDLGIALTLVAALAVVWREWMRRARCEDTTDLRLLDQYETAWLSQGRRAAIDLATISLLRRGALLLDRTDVNRICLGPDQTVTHPMEAAVLNTVKRLGGLQIHQLKYAIDDLEAPAALVKDGLITPPRKRWLSIVPAAFVAPAILYVGGVEIVHLIAAEQPVTPVVLLTIGGAFAVLRLGLPTLRTRRGDAVLRRLERTAPRRHLATAFLAIRTDPRIRHAA